MSLACAFAWDYSSMLTFRFLQGLGLGGEIPIMITYVNEFAKSTGRGRYTLGIQVLFAVGLVASALLGVWVVPTLGWQWVFFIGAVPGLIAIPLRMTLPESPRWLASRGRIEEADRVMRRIEDEITRKTGRPLPPVPTNVPPVRTVPCRFGDLFRGIYLKRTLTVWVLWICSFFISYGISTWLPSIYRTVYGLPLQTSLNYGFIQTGSTLAGTLLCVFIIDLTGRKRLFVLGLLGTSLPLLSFLLFPATSPEDVLRRICTE
jgi:MFS transporter, putative metabolite:H+ symporter